MNPTQGGRDENLHPNIELDKYHINHPMSPLVDKDSDEILPSSKPLISTPLISTPLLSTPTPISTPTSMVTPNDSTFIAYQIRQIVKQVHQAPNDPKSR